MTSALRHVRALLRTWRGRTILLVVASQLALPLHYYLVRRDPHDERFAWRMFSPMRMARCEPTVAIDGKPFPLASEFHDAWLGLARRGRFVVIEAMAARLCAIHAGSSVVVSVACEYRDHSTHRWGGDDMCVNPQLSR